MESISLTSYDLERYDRQIMIFGEEGQRRLKQASVMVAGVGGLGCAASLYLSAAGVGRIRLVDNDVVDLSNLNRQVLHWDGDVGVPKVESALRKLRALNPSVVVEAVNETITDANALELVGDADAIVDCLDNFPTRYVLNRVACQKEVPFFHAAVYGMEARATTIVPGETACLRCLYPAAPPPAKFPVLGAAPGLAAMVQVMEVIKYLAGVGSLLKNLLLIFDGEVAHHDEMTIKRNPSCPDCGFLVKTTY